jgi:hypothetical protein
MAITEWHEPIHECQKGEVQRERCYLEPYFFFNGNLKDYAELLQYAFDKLHAKTLPETRQDFEEYLSKHPICFYPDDVRKGKPPSLNQLQHWSKGQNTSCDEKHNWDARRSSKRNEVNRLAEENLAAQLTEDLPYFYECVKRGFKEVDESVKNSKMMGNFTPHQAESATKGRNHAVNSLLQLTGKDKNYNVKADVDSNTKVEYQNVDNLLEAFRASKAEWDKHKQQQ